MQSEARALPVVSTYFPASHSIQSDATAAPTVALYVPAIQEMQDASDNAPVPLLYFPAKQSIHAVLFALKCVPVSHRSASQHSSSVAPAMVSGSVFFAPAVQVCN